MGKNRITGWIMDYVKHLKAVSGINTAKLAMWVALIFVVVVAGIAVLGSGPS
jgi:hypothetical protein